MGGGARLKTAVGQRGQTSPDVAARQLFSLVGARFDSTQQPQIAHRHFTQDVWADLLALAAANGVTCRIHSTLASSEQKDALEVEPMNKLALRARQSHCRNLGMRAELRRVMSAFNEIGIQVIPLKGPVLADLHYNEPGLREFGDLDFLVRPSDLERSWELMEALGYQSPYKNVNLHERYHVVFVNQKSGELLELHWRIAGPQFGKYRTGEFLWEVSKEKDYLGKVKIVSPSVESTILYLAIHAYKHNWGRLQWLLDFPEICRPENQIEWDRLEALAREQGALQPLQATFQICRHFFPQTSGPPEGHELTKQVLGRRRLERIRRILLTTATDAESLADFYRFRVALADSARDKLRLIVHSLRPTDRDHDVLRLPRWMAPLGVLFRPFRLAWRMVGGYSRQIEKKSR